MATRKRTELEEELMTDVNIARVIKLLEEPDEGCKPITKKEACQILGMAYNTTRLGTIIEQFKAKQKRTAERRAQLRGKPVTQDEIVYIIGEYLMGESIDAISKTTYRSTAIVKKVLTDNAVPLRVPGHSYFNPQLIPEGAVRDRFAIGEVVYSARYDSVAQIMAEFKDKADNGWVYRIWLLDEKWLQSAYQPVYELASLEHIRELGVKV